MLLLEALWQTIRRLFDEKCSEYTNVLSLRSGENEIASKWMSAKQDTIMLFQVSVERAIHFTKLSVTLARSWPPSRHATKWEVVKFDVLWAMSFLLALSLLLPLIFSILLKDSGSLILTQSACYVGFIGNFMIKMIIYRVQRRRTQTLINEMEEIISSSRPHERNVFQRYVNRCSTFHTIITFVNYMTAVVVVCGPLFLPQEFPTDALYPFATESTFTKYVVYIHQILVGLQCSTGATIDCQTALMMWFAGARFELLIFEIQNTNDENQFRFLVKKHQHLLHYADEVSRTMRFIALTTTMMGGLGTIFSGLQLLSNQPFGIKMQFAPVVIVAAMNLFVCAWPADNLIQVCQNMGTAVYASLWFQMSPRMMKNFLMILRRSQKPVTVHVGGFLPTLSLNSYAAYLSAAFSYTTTLRIVLSSESDK